jgi:catechol 2,3-dioxygenase-like lactoylglutathione lyase family enzyme
MHVSRYDRGMRIRGLDHVQLAMPAGGEEEARRFYAGVLGMTEIEKPEPLRGRGGCWFRGGGAEIHLGVEEGFRPARKAHPALAVADYEAVRAELGGEPDAALPGVRRFYTEDPFGNRIEIGAFTPVGACPNLLVRDLDAALPWYVEKLGFDEARRLPGPPPGVLLERDGLPLLLEQTEAPVENLPRSKVDPYGLDALYVVRDLRGLHEEFRERGLANQPLPENAGTFMIRTPEGYIVVFSSGL